MVRFIWDPDGFHNYDLEMLNLFFFFTHCLSTLTQKCHSSVSPEWQVHLKPFSLISSTSDSSKMIDQTIRTSVELLMNASRTLSLLPGSFLYLPVNLTQALAQALFFTTAFSLLLTQEILHQPSIQSTQSSMINQSPTRLRPQQPPNDGVQPCYVSDDSCSAL